MVGLVYDTGSQYDNLALRFICAATHDNAEDRKSVV